MTKVMTIVGTRPEIIRLSRVIARLDTAVDHVLVHTGQNYDYELNGIFFDELEIRKPNHFLGVDTSSLGHVLGETLIKTETVLRSEKPDAVLVLGDTNSSISTVMAKRMHIPVYHMEAGNRCFDANVPEETNRRLVDHVADFNLVYTEHARRNLLAEGLHPRRIVLTGSPMREVLSHHAPEYPKSTILDRLDLSKANYMLVSAHREETVDRPQRLRELVSTLIDVHQEFRMPIQVSTHPRTRKKLDALQMDTPPGIVFRKPMGFIDYIRLQQDAYCVLSDSGTISEESAILGFPAVILRDSMERPESLDAGTIVMTGIGSTNVIEGIRAVVDSVTHAPTIPHEYAISDTSERVLRFLLSTSSRHAKWAGIGTE